MAPIASAAGSTISRSRGVGLGLPAVGEVAGEDDGLRRDLETAQPRQGAAQVLVGVDRAVERSLGQQVRVADVGDDVCRQRVCPNGITGKA